MTAPCRDVAAWVEGAGAVERAILAAVAMSDRWLSAQDLERQLSIDRITLDPILWSLVRRDDLDWNGVSIGVKDTRYHLPMREVRFGRRLEVAS